MEQAGDRERQDACTWAEVFSALDAAGVSDGFDAERDVRPAEERTALDAFFCAESGSDAEE